MAAGKKQSGDSNDQRTNKASNEELSPIKYPTNPPEMDITVNDSQQMDPKTRKFFKIALGRKQKREQSSVLTKTRTPQRPTQNSPARTPPRCTSKTTEQITIQSEAKSGDDTI